MSSFDVKSACADVLSGLKPFQRDTVEHIDALFSRKVDSVHRVLVADEVGMGKTLIAKGVIAKTAVLRREVENDELFKVVYVCSNSAIANQNLAKLSIDANNVDIMNAGESRLSMQHLIAHESESRTLDNGKYIQLIPLTPGTSFNLDSGGGVVQERALICAVLEACDTFPGMHAELERLLEYQAEKSFGWNLKCYRKRVAERGADYLEDMKRTLDAAEQDPNLGPRLQWVRGYVNGRKHNEDMRAVANLRNVFAHISVSRLDPDLVIMDEFQRFRNLLDQDDESETGILAKRFLTGRERKGDPVRVLLLSATPFKPYSTAAEDEAFFGSEAQEDFLQVVGFLANELWQRDGLAANAESPKLGEFRAVWDEYGIRLSEFAKSGFAILNAENSSGIVDETRRKDSLERVRDAKSDAEAGLREFVARTERNGIETYRDIVVDRSISVAPDADDVRSYLLVNRLFKYLGVGQNVPIEYSESCPFMLSYLKGYTLRKRFVKAARSRSLPYSSERGKKPKFLWVSKASLNAYRELKVPNSRFRELVADVFETGSSDGSDASSLLWVPASRPYYVPDEGPYVGVRGFTKTLVFSSWTMVPRMMSTLLSYEDERRSVRAAHGSRNIPYSYFSSSNESDEDGSGGDNKKRTLPSGRLLFAPAAERDAALLLYPSIALAESVDYSSSWGTMPLADLRERVTCEIKHKLDEIVPNVKVEGSGDQRWYAKAAMLLDRRCCPDGGLYLDALLARYDEDQAISNSAKRGLGVWRQIDETDISDFGPAPEDLVPMLVDMAIGSPAVCAIRLFSRCNAYHRSGKDVHLAFNMAYAFTRKMNTPASTLAVDGAVPSAMRAQSVSHWQRVLRYCINGNFQAVMDEYAHLIGYSKSAAAVCAEIIGGEVGAFRSPSMYTVHTRYDVDFLSSIREEMRTAKAKPMKMRTEFAAAFLEDESGAKSGNHRDALRHAFNSPFRPFVLASTSVGQEGLDFHSYCRRIVHWNLPSNPVDLEQREGRVNRFKSLALRQNIVDRFDVPVPEGNGDVWQAMFDNAESCLCGDDGDGSGLIPFWGLNSYSDDLHVERRAYLRKFGKEEAKYDNLIDVLVRYRAVLGQPRQEELLKKLDGSLTDDEIKSLFVNLSPYAYEHEDLASDLAMARGVAGDV